MSKKLTYNELEEQLKNSRIWAGKIAHSFNNVLSGIFGYTKLVEMDIEYPDKVIKHLKKLTYNTQRAADLVKQILTFSVTKGKTFDSHLPIVDNKALIGTETLMLVDDEPMVVTVFKIILSKYGYTVDIFEDGTSGLAAFKKSPIKYNLIVTDQSMPNMTGAEMAKCILEINPNIPIVLCTGHTEEVTKEKWESIGIKGILKKPVLTSDLLTTIRTILDKKGVK